MDRRFLANGYPAVRTSERSGQIVIIRECPLPTLRQLDDNEYEFSGYGLEWDVVADIGWFTESFRKGAFSETLDDVRFMLGHDYSRPALARSPKTFQVDEDDAGLFYRGTLDLRSPDAMALAVAMNRGDIDKASIGFSGITYEFTEGDYYDDGDKKDHYDIIKVRRLWEISGVNFPAHESSSLVPRALTNAAADTYIANERMKLELLSV